MKSSFKINIKKSYQYKNAVIHCMKPNCGEKPFIVMDHYNMVIGEADTYEEAKNLFMPVPVKVQENAYLKEVALHEKNSKEAYDRMVAAEKARAKAAQEEAETGESAYLEAEDRAAKNYWDSVIQW